MLFKNPKALLIWFLVGLALLLGFLYFIVNDSNIAYKDTQSVFEYTIKVKDAYEEVDKIIERAELNVNIMSDNISDSYNLDKINNEAYNMQYIKSIDGLVKSALLNSPGVDGAWFQLNANLPFSAHAYNWFEFNNDQFIDIREQFEGTAVNERKLSPEEDPYYFSAVTNKKSTWSEIYIDADTKKRMMTISSPVYKYGTLVGVAGIDVSVNNLQQALGTVQSILGHSEIYLADKKDKVILSQVLLGPNVVKVDYPFKELFEMHPGGPIFYSDKFVEKTAIELNLSNDYKLIIAIANSILYKGSGQILVVSCLSYVVSVILFFAFFINQFMLLYENRPKPNLVVLLEKKMNDYKKKKGYEVQSEEQLQQKDEDNE